MTAMPGPGPRGRRSDLPVAELEMDAHLQRTLRRTSVMRQGFYLVVLVVALAGQVSGAVETLGIPLVAAVPAVAALELGGVVVLANADVRRRLGERAVASRLLSVAIAAGAVAFNWLAHDNHLLGGFFAGMSALGYLVWLMHTENQRRDRLRAKGDLAPTTPGYEVVGHWLRHPWLTNRAKSLAKANPELGLYDSLAAARDQIKRERRQAAISKVLHRKIRAAVDPNTADIAIAVYDLDEIATRLADGADYDGLTALIAADLTPARLGLDGSTLDGSTLDGSTLDGSTLDGSALDGSALDASTLDARARAASDSGAPAGGARDGGAAGSNSPSIPAANGLAANESSANGTSANGSDATGAGDAGPADATGTDGSAAPLAGSDGSADVGERPEGATRPAAATGVDSPTIESPILDVPTRAVARAQPVRVLDPSVRRTLEEQFGLGRQAEPSGSGTTGDEPARRDRSRRTAGNQRGAASNSAPAAPATGPLSDTLPAAGPAGAPHGVSPAPSAARAGREGALRTQVHTALDTHVPPGAQRDETTLMELVADVLDLNDIDRLTAAPYVQSWLKEGSRVGASAGGTS
ncbi:hypothetical protein GCM10023322_25280 [Rugosimonospora acidiphila]|uniref:Uncharacterized protein n=1 Tax=Rugosimonospora acidiphila TaxID=556531 RepID=A0ABP9RRF6_9ACTN